jgi:Kef-type K+ transport system membrane component KefB
MDDISAWLLLAVLTAMVHSAQSWHRLAVTLLLLVVFVAAMLGPIRRAASLGRSMWGYTVAIVATAILGKLTGAALTARATGMNWKDSLGLGVLMNTRGLVELVILNAGLELGILSPPLFTMMVIMALVTTFMTTPLLIAMKIRPQQNDTRTS